ncbi:MAG TPA: tRNA preQ1(34) S-adenosylmethionine ribosyltransferase-isomerase QueA [Candidatus Binatia bacterium]|nr:tRNA preQ1(34) S-adenosylmethionine ribosyltransferase-isomerase QueA [Candidatus Binatia bacterium]
MLVSDFDYDLPEELIARQPLADRAASRMLHVERGGELLEDRMFRELPELLRADDLLVLNNSQVLPARLYGHRSGSRAQKVSPGNPAAKHFLRGRVEVLLTKQFSAAPMEWEALVHPGRKLGLGERLYFGAEADESSHELAAEIVGRGTFGERRLRFDPVEDFFGVLGRIGHVPLPPYINRPDTPADRQTYQTVYARWPGSVAAPTAGLHFTPGILQRIRERGIESAELTLHIGLGTFQPVRVSTVEEHRLHSEWFEIPQDTARRIQLAREQGRRIVAVGTTTVRTLEFAVRQDPEGRITAQRGEADLFIYPGFGFRVIGAMLTNFHLPKSTLLMLVSAFAGRQRILHAYKHAVRQRYRFYSYGDCMFVE